MTINKVTPPLVIDEMRLDQEWIRQPQLCYEWSVKLAEARKMLDEVRNEYELTKAQVDKEVRLNPEKHGLGVGKLTESWISAVVPLNDEVQEANQSMVEARYQVELYQAAVTAIEHRKRALENLVKLHGLDYFAEPAAPAAAKARMDEQGKSRVRHLGQKRVVPGSEGDTDDKEHHG